MKKYLILAVAAVMLISLAACSQTVSADVLQSSKPRVTSPAVSPGDMNTLASGNNAFAFNLYQSLKGTNGNLFYSPYSISEALAMTYGGARGNTESQMANTLQFLLSQSQLHPAFNNLDQILSQRGQGAKGTDQQGFRLHIANAIWGQKDYSFLSSFLDLLAQNYGAGLRVLDFQKSPEPSRVKINQWVSDQTEQKIQNLLPAGSITDQTRLVLTNAIYFNAAWATAFKATNTTSSQFNLLDGGTAAVQLMNQTESYGYAKGDNYQAVDLPYDGNQLSMTVLLPNSGQFKTFEDSLNSQKVADIVQNLKSQTVVLSFPKFTVDARFSLKETLSAMGMPDAFNNADFSGIDGKKDLEISDVIHQANVVVDEAGTEAAAATGVIMRATAMPAQPVTVTVDRPFIFFIRDIQTGTTLFIGRVLNPAQQ